MSTGVKDRSALGQEPPQKEIRSTITRLVWPATVESVLQMGVGLVNTGMVGHLSAMAIGAVGLCNRATMLAWVMFQAISTGTTVIVAQSIGAGNRDKARSVAAQAVVLGTVSVAILAIAFYVLALPLLAVFSPEPALLEAATQYLRILVVGMPAVGIMTSVGAGMRGAGDTRSPMIIAVLVNILNVAGNWTLIYGNMGFPALGMAGSALATVISQWLGAILALLAMTSRNSTLGISWRGPWRLARAELGEMLGIGLPASGESLFWQLAAIVLTFFITGFGTNALAAHQLGLNAESLSYMPTAGFGIAATTLVGQSMGANRPDLARRYSRELTIMAVALTVVTGGLLLFMPHTILGFLTKDPEVISLGAIYLRLMATVQIPQQLQGVLTGALRGAGDTRSPMYIAAIGIWGIRLPLGYLLAFPLKMGIVGVWAAMTLDLAVRFVLTLVLYRRMPWVRDQVRVSAQT